jgi:redox-sensing transcriptional repressor
MSLHRALIERLVRYHQALVRLTSYADRGHFSTEEIGRVAGVDASQVRKDMAKLGVAGRSRVGFSAEVVIDAIKCELGLDGEHEAVVVGCGRLGSALVAHREFQDLGLKVVAAFDIDSGKAGTRIAGLSVLPLGKLEATLAERDVKLAIVAVPREAAQNTVDRLVAAGILAIWNFAPWRVTVPDHVYVREELMEEGLGELSHRLRKVDAGGT